MAQRDSGPDYYRRRAEAEIAIAKAAGAQKATASPDFKTVFIQTPRWRGRKGAHPSAKRDALNLRTRF